MNKHKTNCPTCKKELIIPEWKYKSKKKKIFYCSKCCWLNRPSVFLQCKNCRKLIRRKECVTKRNKTGNLYCSRKCRYADPESFDYSRTGKFMACKTCGKQIYTTPALNKEYINRYCSIKCRSKDPEYCCLMTKPRIKGKVIRCDACGKEVFKHLYQLKKDKKHYCSALCLSKSFTGRISKRRNGRVVPCALCGKNIYRALWRLNSYKYQFCSKVCMNKYTVQFLIRPTRPEMMFNKLVTKYNLPYRYTGDGSYWISNINPDFIHKNEKKVVEIFGDYWHNPKLNKYCKERNTEVGRKERFRKHGYDCLVLWEKEFTEKNWEKYILDKIKKWEN